MSIPISHIVNVNISLSPTAIPLKGFGQLAMVTDETPEVTGGFNVAERIRTYGSLAAVQADFAIGTEASNAATAFYAQQAELFSVILTSTSITAGILTGGTPDTVGNINLITTGTLDITIDGVLEQLTGLDFSAAADEAAIAVIIDTALSGATCTFDGDSYVITSSTTGSTSTVSYPATSTTVTALGLLVGASTVDGLDIETPAEALVAAQKITKDFYGIVLNKKWRDTTATIDVATWAEASTKMFFNTSNNPNALTTSTDHIIADLKAMTLDRTLSSYSSSPDEYPSASIAGRAFIVNFEGTNTTITLNLKQGPTITVEDLTLNQKLNLEGHNGNAFTVIAGANMYSDSRLASAKWFDTIHGTDWLKNRAETDVFNVMFQSTTKIPYTDAGVTTLYQALEGALRQGVTNGLIGPGNDLEGNFMPLGYEITAIPVSKVSPSDKSNRIYRGLSFKAAGSGAIHGAVISGDFNG